MPDTDFYTRVFGPPRASLHDGRALRAYDAGHDAALRCIARYGLAWHPEYDDCFTRWQSDDHRAEGGWYAQGWDDCFAAQMADVVESCQVAR